MMLKGRWGASSNSYERRSFLTSNIINTYIFYLRGLPSALGRVSRMYSFLTFPDIFVGLHVFGRFLKNLGVIFVYFGDGAVFCIYHKSFTLSLVLFDLPV